ncbi:DUF6746 family protein [Halopseudomonas phragmitis]|uniref:Uncharacterized protein n=2 Tax=Pseudomonadaceae TaxID=135621 RepID=A0A1V0B750_9GAMM|nr:DUF6746 family protein [Halopseudomonas phragmitis]AQZ95711.1 hypothetical protein BVH74_13545 [Halopseudomonas phragmitis]PAU87165.1 hypothetical protein CK507_10645 [Pseudomonas sp. WN033]RHW22669.1 hypothetical protein C2846_03320 [Pseudomonas jilinensis]
MRVFLLPVTLTAALMSVNTALASGDIEHFKGLPANSLEQALSNFVEYNKRLENILAGELTTETMTQVHELTYTLENALERIRQDSAELAETLEEVHLASERYDAEAVRKHGQDYLKVSSQLVH